MSPMFCLYNKTKGKLYTIATVDVDENDQRVYGISTQFGVMDGALPWVANIRQVTAVLSSAKGTNDYYVPIGDLEQPDVSNLRNDCSNGDEVLIQQLIMNGVE